MRVILLRLACSSLLFSSISLASPHIRAETSHGNVTEHTHYPQVTPPAHNGNGTEHGPGWGHHNETMPSHRNETVHSHHDETVPSQHNVSAPLTDSLSRSRSNNDYSHGNTTMSPHRMTTSSVQRTHTEEPHSRPTSIDSHTRDRLSSSDTSSRHNASTRWEPNTSTATLTGEPVNLTPMVEPPKSVDAKVTPAVSYTSDQTATK